MIDELVQVGPDRPPVHPDGSAVITPLLWDRLSPVERAHWSGDDLRGYLTRSLWASVGPDLIDGWGLEDFVGYGLWLACEKPIFEPWQIAHRAKDKITNLRKRQGLKEVTELEDDPYFSSARKTSLPNQASNPYASAEFVPSVFPDEVWAWIKINLSPKMAEGIRLWLEEQYTQEEIAKLLRVSLSTVKRSVAKLRSVIETYPVRD